MLIQIQFDCKFITIDLFSYVVYPHINSRLYIYYLFRFESILASKQTFNYVTYWIKNLPQSFIKYNIVIVDVAREVCVVNAVV